MILALFIAATTTLGAMTADAQDYVNIVLANGVVARIRTAGQYGSMYERETRINQRLVSALSNELANIFPPKMKVAKADGRYTVSVGNTWLIQVYPEDASGARTDVKSLAYQWKDNFAARLPWAVSPSKVPAGYPLPKLPDGPVATGPVPSGLPAHDEPLVGAMVREMTKIRAMSEAEFTQKTKALEAGMLAMVVGYRQQGNCATLPTTFRRVRSLFTVLRGTGMDDNKFAINKKMYAGTTIKKIREQFKTPVGTGPIPTVAQVAMPLLGTPGPAVTVQPIDAPRITSGTPIAKALLGSGLDPNNQLINPGQQFTPDIAQVLLYLQVKNAPNNTMVGVTIRMGEEIIGKRRMNLGGDRTLAVTFYPQTADRFTEGDYLCEITAGDQTAAVIPFRIGNL